MDKQAGQISDAYDSVSFVSDLGLQVRATPLHLGRHEIRFELVSPGEVVRTSEVLREFRVTLRERTAYAGRATTTSVTQAGTQTVCVASLEDEWMEPGLPGQRTEPAEASGAFDGFLDYWQKYYHVHPGFKVVVADLQTFLADLRLWLEQIDAGICPPPPANSGYDERALAQVLGKRTTPVLDVFFEKFERAAAETEEEWRPASRVFARRQLHALLLCAPFLHRTYRKPLGYAGDYEMVNMISRDPLEGGSLYARLINLWFLEQPPALAHRNRLDFLEQRINEAAVRALQQGRRARVVSLAAGPALEVQQFLRNHRHADHVEFTLIDFNEETLEHARSRLEEIKRLHHRTSPIEFTKKSVNTVLRESVRPAGQAGPPPYDLVYCAGLFDYLSDSVCRRVSNVLYEWVRPGGLFLSTNVHTSNPWPMVMDFIMEWHLIYRTSPRMAATRPERVALEDCALSSDPTGVNIYLETRKPELVQPHSH
jgi:extracellular factor (EF) 3-hydroxypalmitic acid methyl ester biosynthesis protein